MPWALFAFPFYLWKRSPGKEGSHYDPECDLFTEAERNQVRWGVLGWACERPNQRPQNLGARTWICLHERNCVLL